MRFLKHTYLVILFLLMLATVLLTEQRWADADVYAAIGVIGVALIGALFTILKRGVELTISDAIIGIWILYYVGRVWIGNEFYCRTEFLKAMQLLLLYCSLRLLMNKARVSERVLIILIIVGGCYEAMYGAWQMVEGSSRHPMFALTGNLQNPGPYSAYLMLGLVVGVVTWLLYKEEPKESLLLKFIYVAMIPISIVLPATWSRAAFISIAMIALWLFRQYYWKYRYIVWGVLFIAGLLFYFVKQGSADGRIIIWQSSITKWCDSPWFGVGIGGFLNTVAEGMTLLNERNIDLTDAGVTDNAYNILVKILVEQGIVGGLVAIILCIVLLKTLYMNSRPLFYGMLSLLIFSMFSYPFDLLPYKIITVVVIAWSESKNGKRVCMLGRVNTFILSCLLIFFSWQMYKLMKESYEADKDYTMIRGLYDKSFIKDYYDLLTLEGDNPQFLFDFGKILREQGRYNDSNAILRQGTLCSADPMFYVLMGNNYRDMEYYDLAEHSYKKAFSIMPNRIYPLYQLMQMYVDRGNMIKSKTMAEKIIEMKPKIQSPATREMKDKAKRIINL